MKTTIDFNQAKQFCFYNKQRRYNCTYIQRSSAQCAVLGVCALPACRKLIDKTFKVFGCVTSLSTQPSSVKSKIFQSQHSLSHVLKMAEGNRVFVGNITNRVQKHELKGDFEKYGRVHEVFIGNGFGFITFGDARSASRAVDVSFIFNSALGGVISVSMM